MSPFGRVLIAMITPFTASGEVDVAGAAALATHQASDAFLVGLAASLGAGISMGFAEALSDDGSLTGRGHPWMRGLITGLMTAVGGIGHTLPFLISDFNVAMIAPLRFRQVFQRLKDPVGARVYGDGRTVTPGNLPLVVDPVMLAIAFPLPRA